MGPESNYDNIPTYSAQAAGDALLRVSQLVGGETRYISTDRIESAVSSFSDQVGYLQEQIDFLMKVMQDSLPNTKNWAADRDSLSTKSSSTYSDTDDFDVDNDELDSFLSDFARAEG